MNQNNHHISPLLAKGLSMAVFLLMLLVAKGVGAQPHYSEVLRHAEAHNPTLLAAAKHAEAERSAAHLGALLPDPEVEAAYFLSNPADLGVRWDLNFSQSFEMPSVLVRRARLRNLQEHAAELSYEIVRRNVLMEVQQLCADWIYYHAMVQIYARRTETATHLAELYNRRFEAGDCSVLEFNRAQMYLADMQNQASEAWQKEDHCTHDLRTIVGDDAYTFFKEEYDPIVVSSTFEQWYEQMEMRNPSLRQLENQIAIGRQQTQLSRASWLPSMSVGYASENRVGETFQGVKVGLTLPIWSQQRAVRTAQLETEAASQELEAQRTVLYNKLSCMFHRHEALLQNVQKLKAMFQRYNSLEYLERALEAGEINLEQYLQQSDFYHEMELKIWSTAHELEQIHLYLYSIEL